MNAFCRPAGSFSRHSELAHPQTATVRPQATKQQLEIGSFFKKAKPTTSTASSTEAGAAAASGSTVDDELPPPPGPSVAGANASGATSDPLEEGVHIPINSHVELLNLADSSDDEAVQEDAAQNSGGSTTRAEFRRIRDQFFQHDQGLVSIIYLFAHVFILAQTNYFTVLFACVHRGILIYFCNFST